LYSLENRLLFQPTLNVSTIFDWWEFNYFALQS
jgi:hypothetical protein